MAYPLSNLSIARKLALIIGLLSANVLLLMLCGAAGLEALGSARAYVHTESLWSKAQKQALYQLNRYARLRREDDYAKFEGYLALPLRQRMARLEMEKPHPDAERMRKAFQTGGVDRRDVPAMIAVYERLRSTKVAHESLQDWRLAEQGINELSDLGRRIHAEIRSHRPRERVIAGLLDEADALNDRLTAIEDRFSTEMGRTAHRATHVALGMLFAATLLLMSLALAAAVAIARHLSSRLHRLRRSADRVARGEAGEPLDLLAGDEIGQLSRAFDAMVSERARQTAQVLAANRELESFSYSVSHDLRAPLRAIDGFSEMILDDHGAKLEPPVVELAQSIRRNAKRMGTLIEGLLSFSHLSGKPVDKKRTDMTALAQSVVDELRPVKDHGSPEMTVDPLGAADCDPVLIRQVFINLIGNAIKFTSRKAEAKIRVSRRTQDSWDVFLVSDNGAGFDMRYAERLFGAFQRLHDAAEFEGSGIGLALVQRIIARHGGLVWAEGKPSSGATFYFSLPQKSA